MTDDFTGQWAQEIPIEEIEKLPMWDGIFDVSNLSLEITRPLKTITEFLKMLGIERLDQKYIFDYHPRIMDIKSKSIGNDVKFLYELTKSLNIPFKIFYKDLYPGDTNFSYKVWVEFQKEEKK